MEGKSSAAPTVGARPACRINRKREIVTSTSSSETSSKRPRRKAALPDAAVAAGATVVVFTTGRGTTIGNAIVPVIKLASNTATYERLSRDIDLSAGGVIDGTETIESVGARVFERILAVARGDRSLAEQAGHREFQIWSARTRAPA